MKDDVPVFRIGDTVDVHVSIVETVEVGRGKLSPKEIPEIIEAKDRTLAGPTAPASGLCLVSIRY